MKVITCPVCHVIMSEVLDIIERDKARIPQEQLKFYTGADNYRLYVDQGLPTQRRYDFYECEGCGFVAMFNGEKIK